MILIEPSNRVIIKVDLESKNSHTFKDGTKIRLERIYDNFNMRYVKPVNGIVVNAKDIPEGAEILIHHNATHDIRYDRLSSKVMKVFMSGFKEKNLSTGKHYNKDHCASYITSLLYYRYYFNIIHRNLKSLSRCSSSLMCCIK